MAKILETDLHKPVKKYFESLGYVVNAEVKNCDLTAYKENKLIVIELKTNFNMTVLYQALDRQKISNEVFIAIPKPKRTKNNRTKMSLVCQKLNLGLLLVSCTSNNKSVEVVVEPKEQTKQKNNARSRSVIQEIKGRTMDNNIGGSTRRKITTAYTEKAIYIAYILFKEGNQKASNLVKKYNCATNAREILYNNYYGWFGGKGKGVYELTEKGRESLQQEEYVMYLRKFQEVER